MEIQEKGLVSIAIPAYKRTFLKDSINSALTQDYENIELIIVNDCSPYDLNTVVSQFHDKRIKYYENDINLGKENVVKNWNKCLEYAKGEYFVLLCDDDILKPNFVSELIILANKYSSCNVFHSRRIERNELTGEERIDNIWPEWESLEAFYENKLKWQRLHSITEFLYRTEHIKKHKYIEFPVAWGSDDISILNMISDGGIASTNKPLAVFRLNDEHLSKLNNRIVEKAQARILNFYWCAERFTGNQFDTFYMNELGKMLVNFVRTASFFDKFRIISVVPPNVWDNKKKIRECIMIFLGRRRHPGYRCLGV